MRHELRLADIGEGLDEAEIVAWLVKVGDLVARDQSVVEVMTDKSNAELPAPWSGTVVELSGAIGDIINVGDLLAVIESVPTQASGAEAHTDAAYQWATAAPAEAPRSSLFTDREDPTNEAAAPVHPSASGVSRPKASPATRRAALERGIDLTTVAGSGPGGRILLEDLDVPSAPVASPTENVTEPDEPPSSTAPTAHEATGDGAPRPASTVPQADTAPAPSPAVAPRGRTEPLRGIRRVIARNMTQSWSQIPHIHAFQHIDAQPLLEFRDRLKKTGRASFEQLTPLAIFVAAVAAALEAHPQANASIDIERDVITYHETINIGIAVAAPQGLVVPVLHAAETLDFETLCVAVAELVAAARGGLLPVERMRDGTATVTNFGSLGGEQATPLIRPPESLIVGFGSIRQRPFVVDDSVIARNTMHLVVGADHRLLDGDVTTSILRHIADTLVEPLSLFLGP